jgi:hypothetical protein
MFAICTRNLQPLTNFGAAKHFFEATEKPKNWAENERPLDNKRMRHKRLVKAGDSYACYLYQTPMVTFLPNELHLHCDDRVSSFSFSHHYEHAGAQCVSDGGRMFWKVLTDDGWMYYREGRESLKFKRTAAGNWKLYSKAAVLTERVLDREAAKPIREALKPYAQWYIATKRLGVDLSCRVKGGDYYATQKIINRMRAGKNVDFLELARNIGAPATIKRSIYQCQGITNERPVPPDRLPSRRYT